MIDALQTQLRIVHGVNAKSKLARLIMDQTISRIHRYELAQLAGLSVEYTSRILREWEEAGFIQRGRKTIEILNIQAFESQI